MDLFADVCRARGAGHVLDEMQPSALQQALQTAVNHIRAIVECVPRGQALDKIDAWRRTAEANMAIFLPEMPPAPASASAT